MLLVEEMFRARVDDRKQDIKDNKADKIRLIAFWTESEIDSIARLLKANIPEIVSYEIRKPQPDYIEIVTQPLRHSFLFSSVGIKDAVLDMLASKIALLAIEKELIVLEDQ